MILSHTRCIYKSVFTIQLYLQSCSIVIMSNTNASYNQLHPIGSPSLCSMILTPGLPKWRILSVFVHCHNGSVRGTGPRIPATCLYIFIQLSLVLQQQVYSSIFFIAPACNSHVVAHKVKLYKLELFCNTTGLHTSCYFCYYQTIISYVSHLSGALFMRIPCYTARVCK